MTVLVVTDLDGTFWDTTLHCHPQVRQAFVDLQHRDDVEVLLATGRRRTSAARGLGLNSLEAPAVLLNGAVGYDFATGEQFHEATFSSNDLADVVEVLRGHALAPVAYSSDSTAFAVEGVTTGVAHLEGLGDELEWTTAAELIIQEGILGMSMLGIEQARIEVALDDLAAIDTVESAAYADALYPPYSLMLAPTGITKEVGIRSYLDYSGITPTKIVALGDGGNDLEMLEMADVALVVHDGDARAVALADQLIDSPEHGGWATVLDHLD